MKKKLALLLGMTMALSVLGGCGTAGKSTDQSADKTAEAVAQVSADAGSSTQAAALTDENGFPTTKEAQDAIAERKSAGKYPTIAISFMNWSGAPAGQDRIAQAISKRTEETLGIDVSIQIMDAASYPQNMNLMLASGEQVDLFNAVSVGYLPCINKGYLYDLEEDNLLGLYGQGMKQVVGDKYMEGSRMDGKLYGVTSLHEMAAGKEGIVVVKKYLDEIGFDYSSMYKNADDEIIYTDINTINDMFAKMHAKHPDKAVIFFNNSGISRFMNVDKLGDGFGVLTDPTNSLTVENLYESESYQAFVKQMREWNQAGYFSADALTETTSATAQMKAGSTMAEMCNTKPGVRAQEGGLVGDDVVVFQVGEDFTASDACMGMPWCINSQTKDPVAAMQLLNALYTDPVLSNLICWGEEGTDYVRTDDGHFTFPEGVTAADSKYYNNVNWEMPNQMIAGVWEGNALDIWDQTTKFNDNAKISKAFGFTFNNSDVSNEFTALTNVVKEYQGELEFGFADPDSTLAEMNQKLKAAGLDTYMQAKQKAMDAWASSSQK